jgi:hypothetical protein
MARHWCRVGNSTVAVGCWCQHDKIVFHGSNVSMLSRDDALVMPHISFIVASTPFHSFPLQPDRQRKLRVSSAFRCSLQSFGSGSVARRCGRRREPANQVSMEASDCD